MTFYFHQDRELYFRHQFLNTISHVIPFIKEQFQVAEGTDVMEVGCGEGGVLKGFLSVGCRGVGVELNRDKFLVASELLREEIETRQLRLLNMNIYDFKEDDLKFDLIVLKDVIEHIHDQEKLMKKLKTLLKPGGCIFLGFPPWQMPFGGHQQICKSRFLSLLPYFHLLPAVLYRGVLKLFGESRETADDLLEIKETGISIERFKRIIKRCNYSIMSEKCFLINPIYEYKFKLKPREQTKMISNIPYIRNFLTTCIYYLITPK